MSNNTTVDGIEIPDCYSCPNCDFDGICMLTGRSVADLEVAIAIPDWCPLEWQE